MNGRAARRLGELGTQRAQTTIERRLFRAGQRLDDADQSLQTAIRAKLNQNTAHWTQTDLRLCRLDLRLRLQTAKSRTQQASAKIDSAIRRRLTQAQSRATVLTTRLHALNPLQILERGFAVVSLPNGHVFRRPGDAPPGTHLQIRLAEGAIEATAGGPIKPGNRVHK